MPLFLLLWIFTIIWLAPAAMTAGPAMLVEVKGAIGPATQDFIHRSLEQAVAERAPVVILQLDTPGGLSDSMRGIVQDIIASPIPVLAYVAPSGARAASAGTYILYAAHIAAMAPGTNVGAAYPVSIGHLGRESAPANEPEKAKPLSVEALKTIQDARASIRSLAELRHRNVAWAELAVTKAASLSAQEALQQKVIDIIAANPPSLLTQADGRTVLIRGQPQIIHSQGLDIHTLTPDWRTRLLATITNPSVAYILLIIGVYGLFFEFMNPGMMLPGVAGIISVLLACYAFQLLPIDYVGLALIVIGLGFIIAEIFSPAFGALGIGGAVAFLVGSIMLFKPEAAGFSLPLPTIIATTAISLLLFLGVAGAAIRSRRRPVVSGCESMVGQIGEVSIDRGDVWVHVVGERWQVIGGQHLQPAQQVKVIAVKGLKLLVKPINSKEVSDDY